MCCLQAFKKRPEHFPGFFQQVLECCLKDTAACSLKEQTALLVFLNHCFNSMEVDLIREQVKRLVSLSMWVSLQQVSIRFILKVLSIPLIPLSVRLVLFCSCLLIYFSYFCLFVWLVL